ncbi:TPA: hypothetical protein P7Z02_003808 [Citrobacter koseri]|nr:hypothetical protein [Citrobacter koseri]HDQ2586694.1 hypothetical protein [Citrobacter koseri]
MMEIKERLALSARPGKLTLIREGMSLKCYQQSLFSLVHYVYPDIKVTGRRIKNSADGLYSAAAFLRLCWQRSCRMPVHVHW